MTTRQEKRIRRKQLIIQLEQLETQHRAIDGQLSCRKCDICTQIRAIGKQLSSPEDETIGRRNNGNTLNGRLTVAEYLAFKDKRVSDRDICNLKRVSTATICDWKRENNIFYRLSRKGVKR